MMPALDPEGVGGKGRISCAVIPAEGRMSPAKISCFIDQLLVRLVRLFGDIFCKLYRMINISDKICILTIWSIQLSKIPDEMSKLIENQVI